MESKGLVDVMDWRPYWWTRVILWQVLQMQKLGTAPAFQNVCKITPADGICALAVWSWSLVCDF